MGAGTRALAGVRGDIEMIYIFNAHDTDGYELTERRITSRSERAAWLTAIEQYIDECKANERHERLAEVHCARL